MSFIAIFNAQLPHTSYVAGAYTITPTSNTSVDIDAITSVDEAVKLYRGLKYEYISADNTEVALDRLYQQIQILTNAEEPAGSATVLIQEEGEAVGFASTINFVGGNVTATLDEDDETNHTVIVTVGSQTYLTASFTDTLIDEEAGISELDVTGEELISDANILLDAYWGEGRAQTIYINLTQTDLWPEGFSINLKIENAESIRDYILIRDADDNTLFTNAYSVGFAEGIYRISFQKRDGVIVLTSHSIEKRNEGPGPIDPYVRWDTQQDFEEGQKDYICDQIGAAKATFVRDSFVNKYSNVIKETSNTFSTAGNIFGDFSGYASGSCIIRMVYNGAKTVTLNYIDPTEYTASKLPTINYLTIVNANNGTLTIDGTDDIFEGDAIFTLEPNETALLCNFMYYENPFYYTRWTVIKKPFVASGGYELTANKATDFSVTNNTLYPTTQAVQDQLDLKLNAADYNDRFKGAYASLVALQTAHPTANAGDYALVDTIGVDAQWYIWDDTDGDWVPGAGAGSGPVTTDDLPEGSTNLYFTTPRASAAAPVQSVNGATGTVVLDTDDVAEGANKYYSDAQVETYVTDHYLKYSGAQTLDAGEQTQAQTNLGLGTMATEDAADYVSSDDSVYQFNDQTGTSYALVSGDFIPFGRMIVSVTNAGAISVTVDTPTTLGVAVGSSVNVRQGGAGAITITGSGGATLSSTAVTTGVDKVITLIAKTSTSWLTIGV